MNKKLALLASASLCAVSAMGIASEASAAPAKHKAISSSENAQIEALRAQVEALTARLDAQATQQAQTQTQVQQAQTQAQQAQTQAAAAATQSEQAQVAAAAVPTQVQTAVAALPKPKPGWFDNTTIGGRMYYNVSHIDQESHGNPPASETNPTPLPNGKTDPTGLGFDIKRFYISVDHKFNDVFSADVTTDFQYSSAISSTELYLKKAYLQAKLSDAFVVRVGSADLPWVPFVEDLYGYRYVENVLIDRTKFGTSADWGVHVGGKFADGIISYQISAIDGSGYKAPLRSNHVDFEGRLSATYAGFTAAVGGYRGKLGADKESTVTFHNATREDALIAYANKGLRVGGEYYHTSNWKSVAATGEDKSHGMGAFASYQFTPLVGVFGRYDWVRPNTLDPEGNKRKDQYYNAGISFSPAKIVDFALVYKHDRVDNGFFNTSNGNIGGADDGTYSEVGIWGQFRF